MAFENQDPHANRSNRLSTTKRATVVPARAGIAGLGHDATGGIYRDELESHQCAGARDLRDITEYVYQTGDLCNSLENATGQEFLVFCARSC